MRTCTTVMKKPSLVNLTPTVSALGDVEARWPQTETIVHVRSFETTDGRQDGYW